MPLVIQSLAATSRCSLGTEHRVGGRQVAVRAPVQILDNAATMLPSLKGGWGGVALHSGGRACKRKWRGLVAVGDALRIPNTVAAHAQRRVAVDGPLARSVDFGAWRLSAPGSGIVGVRSRRLNADHHLLVSLDFFSVWTVAAGFSTSGTGHRQITHGGNGLRNTSALGSAANGWCERGETLGIRVWRHSKTVSRAVSHAASSSVETRDSELTVRKGALVEFQKEGGKFVLAVAQERDAKKNWIAIDQTGTIHTIRPQQITYLVPSIEEYRAADIASFVGKVENLQDVGLLEFAWEELLAEKVVHVASLAKILYSQDTTPVECYSVHRMLTENQIYFRRKQNGLAPVYEPRSLAQVKELLQKRLADERAHEQLLSYVKVIRMALECPKSGKPPKSTWHEVDHFSFRTDALKAYALGSAVPAQKKCAEEVIAVMGITKSPIVVANLLIGMGVFPLHVNVDVLKLRHIELSEEQIAAAEQLLHSPQPDPDMETRVDLTEMKVYTIDSDDTYEVDDGLSATRLPDGRIKVWIHIADPTRWLPHDHILSRHAQSRGTSIYLPTGAIPMFPPELAANQMSLKQGCNCCAVTVSVVLMHDGSIAEYSVVNSLVCPTYKLSYDNVAELLLMHVAEEPELYLLAEASSLRARWRTSQGASLTYVPDADIRVTNPDSIEPSIELEVKDQSVPSMQLVSEMMILCGEAVALIGGENKLCLPYRGQTERLFPKHILSNIPEGPSRAFAMRRLLGSADMSFIKPIGHASLGLQGYVQFTSPIRRYADLMAHYQVKAHIRGDVPPFGRDSMEAKMATSGIRTREAKKLQSTAIRYWTIEYLRRQPRDRIYHALILQPWKDREATVLILEVGFRCSVGISSPPSTGSEIRVVVMSADPRKDILILKPL